MRHQLLWCVAIASAVAAVPAEAQRAWEPELGIHAGFMHASPSSGNGVSFWDLPSYGPAGLGSVPLPGALFGVIPLQGRWAVEIGLSLTDLAGGGGNISTLALAPRLDGSITPHLYAAVGPTMSAIRFGGASGTQWGAAGAVGYRIHLTRGLTGRVEGYFEHRFANDAVGFSDLDLYGVQLGVAAVLGRAGQASSAGGRAARVVAPSRAARWEEALVVSGGYVNVFAPGNGSASFFAAPGLGSGGVFGFGTMIPAPTVLSAIIPVSDRFAIEPGADIHSIAPSGGSSATAYEVTARVNYAFDRHLYAAVGAAFSGLSSSGSSPSEWAGTAAVGVRFPLAMGIGGRLEYTYATWNGDGSSAPALQTNALLLGMMAPLK